MKNSFLKKLMAILLTALVAFSVLSVSVFAEENPADTTTPAQTETSAEAEDADGTAAEGDADGDSAFQFKPMNFVTNLKYMGIGMLCIIIVMGVLIGATVLLNKVTAPKE